MPESIRSREERALNVIREFSQKPAKLIENITVRDLIEEGGINPYLVKSLGFKKIDEVVEFFLHRRVERSLGTSFGTVLEKFICEILGGKKGRDLDPRCKRRKGGSKPWICWWDVVIDRPYVENGEEWRGVVISVKSGPADMDKDQVEHFVVRAREAESNGYRPFLALVYGKKAWSVIPQTLKDKGLDPEKYLRVGKEVFEEFLGIEGYHTRALELFSKGGLGVDLFELVEKKKEDLVKMLKDRYGDDLDALLKDTF